ncbi:hypothetical protein [Streptomyces pactum]|uniref:hypothetical protein n=1 Tax=Streptomyces pactum TaxID=68249 RepID=UPI00131BFB77|nr:hypothetical protein [Streptomyces pactum]
MRYLLLLCLLRGEELTRMGKRQLVTRERAGGVTVTLTDTGCRAITTVHPAWTPR